MVKTGAPGICTAEIKLQKPPVKEKLPPVIAALASGWPMVPLTEYWPLLLVPPPPAILYQSTEYGCAQSLSVISKTANDSFIFTDSSSDKVFKPSTARLQDFFCRLSDGFRQCARF